MQLTPSFFLEDFPFNHRDGFGGGKLFVTVLDSLETTVCSLNFVTSSGEAVSCQIQLYCTDRVNLVGTIWFSQGCAVGFKTKSFLVRHCGQLSVEGFQSSHPLKSCWICSWMSKQCSGFAQGSTPKIGETAQLGVFGSFEIWHDTMRFLSGEPWTCLC